MYIQKIRDHLQTRRTIITEKLNQCIINEYRKVNGKHQGISAHTDHEKRFGKEIVTVSLGADTTMVFTHPKKGTVNVFLPRRSVVVMTGESRWKWKHAAPATVKYLGPDGGKITKPEGYRRVSVTFRHVVGVDESDSESGE